MIAETVLCCPRCATKARYKQGKGDLIICSSCGKTWLLAQIAATDKMQAGIAKGTAACNKLMLAVDEATARLGSATLVEAITNGDTTLAEVVGRFRRGLINAGVPK